MLKRLRKIFARRSGQASADAASPPTDRQRRGGTKAPPAVHYGPRVVHRPIPVVDLDPDAVKIVQRLTRFDHAAYLVGGCVRDLLLERKPKDFDLGTSATPRQIRRLFRNCRIIGRRFRLAHIYFQNGKIIEVATFRARDESDTDAENRDLLIRDDNVFGTAEEDALRRDFTVNALFYDVNNETVLDHAEGLEDLRRKLIRTIGDPETRFREDPIRMLRAIRFAARLGFDIESGTLAALDRTRQEIPKAAAPRILEEINRFSRGDATRRSFEILRDTHTFEVVLPELQREYGDNREAWELLLSLLGALDAQPARDGDRVSRIGRILTALLTWPVCGRIGWNGKGRARNLNADELLEIVDEKLRPIASRLRVPRRDQDQCRRVLTTLGLMVPVGRLRGGAASAVLRRDCLPETLWVLEGLAAQRGGQFAEALELGRQRMRQPGPRRSDSSEERAGGARPRRRRGRRRGRGGSAHGEGRAREGATRHEKQVDKQPDKQKAGGKQRTDLPPPWDERYFFAALPSVPEIPEDQGGPDRYGAEALADRTGTADVDADTEAAPDEAAETPRPGRPRRRRRSRRRRKRVGAAASTATDGRDDDADGSG